MTRTRVKICGITRAEDARDAARCGADAIGLVFYAPSPRALVAQRAAELVQSLPPFVNTVGLFVNPRPEEVEGVLSEVRLDLLQFHGDETPEECARFGVPFIKAVRVRPGTDLLQYARTYERARGLLLDAFVAGTVGGTGQTFDWNGVPAGLPVPVILSGGLDADNVAAAIRAVRPWAVDVSSGVESAKGIKDTAKITRFIRGVRDEDLRLA
jgi:phosphoribosylanthranilate isomerase